jgi:hypothetical protein
MQVSTVNRSLQVLRRSLRLAVEWGLWNLRRLSKCFQAHGVGSVLLHLMKRSGTWQLPQILSLRLRLFWSIRD